jgi:nitrile hydratase
MNGIHDMGGMHGFGPIGPEPNEPVFHAMWEERVFALSAAVGAWGRWTTDESRQTIERMPPADYLMATYYEKWLRGMIENAVRHGLITREEVETGQRDAAAPIVVPKLAVGGVASVMQRGSPKTRAVERQPIFRLGDTVLTRNIHPTTHTRLPRYARDKRGIIVALHGAHVFPDTLALGQGENPQPLYTVQFQARALWGDAAKSNDTVRLDLWEDYLAPG